MARGCTARDTLQAQPCVIQQQVSGCRALCAAKELVQGLKRKGEKLKQEKSADLEKRWCFSSTANILKMSVQQKIKKKKKRGNKRSDCTEAKTLQSTLFPTLVGSSVKGSCNAVFIKKKYV